MKTTYYFVYVTTNLKTGRKYVGQHSTYNLDDHYFGSNEELIEDIYKYKEGYFRRNIIEYAEDIYDLAAKELFWIKEFNAVNNPLWYNKSYTCSPNVFFLRKHTKEAKERMKKRSSSTISRRLFRESYPEMGHRKGKKLSEIHKTKIGVSVTGPSNGFFGKTHSDEFKEYMRTTMTGKKQSENHIKKRSEKTKGKIRTEEQKRRISEGQRKRWAERKKNK